MTGFNAPPPPVGPPPAPPPAARPPATPERRAELLGYGAGGLGVLSFVWGFLDWFTNGGAGTGGYSVLGGGAVAAIGLTLVAGLLAAGRAFENRAPSIEPLAVAVAGFLVVLGILVGKSNIAGAGNVDAGIGLILQLITAIVQVGVLGYGWLAAIGRLPASRPHPRGHGHHQPPPDQAQWQQPPGYGQQPPGYQEHPPPGYQEQPAPPYSPPTQPFQQQPPGYQPPPQGYEPPPNP
jgi:hypothetical protein